MKKVKTILEIVTFLVAIIFLWFGYSLFRFDGFFHPYYILGLSDPYDYYQAHIGSRLEHYGQLYDVTEVDTSQWNIYRNLEHRFEFRYPSERSAKIVAQDNHQYYVHLLGGESERDPGCEIEVEFEGWKLGEYGLPSERRKIDFDIENNRTSELWFIRDQYNGVAGVTSTRFSGEKMDIKFTGATFIRENGNKFVHVVDNGNTCDEVIIKGILATFRFID